MQELRGRPVEADLTLLHEVRGLGEREREVHRLLDEDDRRTRGADLVHDRQQLLHDRGRETEGELVDHEQAGPGDERHSERQHLLLTAGEVARGFVEALAQHREETEHVLDAVVCPRAVGAVQPTGEAEVLGNRERREHAVAARHLYDAAPCHFVRRRVGHVAAVEHDRAVRRLDQPRDALQEGRLARAVGAEQRDDLALVDLEVDVEEHLHAVVTDVEVAHEQQLGETLAAQVRDLRLRRGRRPHPVDVGLHVQRCRRERPRADQEDRHHDQEALADAPVVGDVADEQQRRHAGHDEERRHRIPE